jgi:hypothetical protein
MLIRELTEQKFNESEFIYESIADDLRTLIQQQVEGPLDSLFNKIVDHLRMWALENLQYFRKDLDRNELEIRTLKAIAQDPEQFAKRMIDHSLSKKIKI